MNLRVSFPVRRRFLTSVCVAVINVVCHLDAASSGASKPNIVLILADDLGYGDLACQNPASKISTPRLDRLAAQGMRFTDVHAPSALCTPTRYSILTGQYCWRSRLKSGVLNMWDEPLIPQDRLTVAGLLRDSGYRTACVGKWHLGLSWPFVGRVPPGFDTSVTASSIDWTKRVCGGPVDRGFDYYFGVNLPNHPPYVFLENDHVAAVPTVQYGTAAGQQSHWAGPGDPGWDWSQVMPAVTSNSVQWIQQNAQATEPFFLYLALPGPHQPVVPTVRFQGKSKAGPYGDYVQELDCCVGQVLDALDATGAGTNALVIFTSDNGPDEFAYQRLQDCGHASMGSWRGIKNDIWEGGHRVPFVARWPGKVAAGSTNPQLVCLVDFMRTAAAIAGVPVPSNAAEDSVSFLPALLGQATKASGRSSVILESGSGQFGMRSNCWMYIDSWTGDGHNPELEPLWFKQSRGYPLTNTLPALLYDLRGDPAEAMSLYTSQAVMAGQLRGQLRGARASATWSGAQSGYWTVPENWLPAHCPSAGDVVYSNAVGVGNFTQTLGANFSVNSILLDGSLSQKVTICSGGAFGLSLGTGIDMSLANADLTIHADLSLARSQIWNVRSNHTLTINGCVATRGCDLMICGAGNVTITNVISGTGSLRARGSGFILLGGANTFNGGATLCGGGFLVAETDRALGVGDVTVPNNSTLHLMPGVTLTNRAMVSGFGGVFQGIQRGAITIYNSGSATFSGPVILSANTGFYANLASSTLIFGGSISGSGNLTILPGSGTVVLATRNTYTGNTIVQGALKLVGGAERLPVDTPLYLSNTSASMLDLNGNNQTLGCLSGGGAAGGNVVLRGGMLSIDQSGASTYCGILSGTGGLIKTNSGSLTLAGKCTYTGPTIISGGALVVNGSVGNSAVTVGGGLLGGKGTLAGPVTIAPGGSLSTGWALGRLTISNSLTLKPGSTVFADVDSLHQLSDRVQGITRIEYGGTLVVSNLAAPSTLMEGMSFRLFSSSASTGNFNDIRPAPGGGLAWSFDSASGSLRAVAQPNLQLARTDTNALVLSWTGTGFHLQVQSNSAGLGTNWLDCPGGNASPVIVPLAATNATGFLRLVSP